jgi:hypothetical protein
MTIARAQMYRQLYQLGGSPTGIQSLAMDYGAPLQVPSQQQPMFTSTGNSASSPLLNYGQTPLGQAGGTPLTRNGYQEGGITDFYKAEEPIIPRIENIGGLLDQAEKSIGQPANNFTSPLASTFSRFGMQEGGMGMDQMMQPQMQDQAMMQPQMMEPPLQGMEGQQADIKDPQQALEIIIQMLIAQGIPPEQAREIALQMVQAVAEGGMGEMEDQRIEARFGGRIGYASGGIGSLVDREQYGFGSFFSAPFKAIGSVAKGVTNAVKSVVKSDLGKAALAAAAIYFGGPMLASATSGTSLGSSLFGVPMFGAEAATSGILGSGGLFGPMSGSLLGGITQGINQFLPASMGNLGSGILSSLGGNALTSLAGGFLGGALSGGGAPQQQPGETAAEYQARVDKYKAQYAPLLNPTVSYPNNPFYAQKAANGGRIGYQEGGIGDIVSQVTKQEFFGTPMMANGGRMNYGLGSIVGNLSGIVKAITKGTTPDTSVTSTKLNELVNQENTGSTKPVIFQPVRPLYNYTLEDLLNLRKENNDYTYAANGGRMGYALGAEVPTRQNQAGVKELDYRETGGFVPPIGIKEKADDIPAMLSNNEFVFTADAVRNAGNGDVDQGAKRMYTLMKNLENGGSV